MVKIYPKRGEKIEYALKRFRKLCEKEGIIREIKKRAYYEKPSELKARRNRKAIKKGRQLQEEFDELANTDRNRSDRGKK